MGRVFRKYLNELHASVITGTLYGDHYLGKTNITCDVTIGEFVMDARRVYSNIFFNAFETPSS